MEIAIWLGVYIIPIILMLLGVYTSYAMWRFIHNMDEKCVALVENQQLTDKEPQ